jgi:hypothetical protein
MIKFNAAYCNEQKKLTKFNFPDHFSINKNIYEVDNMINKPKLTTELKVDNSPFITIRCGQIKGSAWLNTKKDENGNDRELCSIKIIKSYNTGKEWKDTNNFFIDDMPKVEAVCRKIFEEVRIIQDVKEK